MKINESFFLIIKYINRTVLKVDKKIKMFFVRLVSHYQLNYYQSKLYNAVHNSGY